MNKLEGFRSLVEKYHLPLTKMRGKKAFEKGWPNFGFRSFESIGFNINHNAGVICGKSTGIIVLDVDLPLLFDTLGLEVPYTFTVQTGNGSHHYYKLPQDDFKYGNRGLKDSHGFDIKATGGIAVAPYSIHPETGKRYRIVNDAPLAEAPEWLLEFSRSEDTPTKSSTFSKSSKEPIAMEFEELSGSLISVYDSLLAPKVIEGSRSTKIWVALNKMVDDGLTNIQIVSLFELYPLGLGEKYIKAGGTRIGWLINQIEEVRKSVEEAKVAPFEATNQEWVNFLYNDIEESFVKYNKGEPVPEAQAIALRQLCNLFIALLNGERQDWYCVGLNVGSGKTQTILHLIKFLYTHDTERKHSLAFSLERIEQINEASDWLIKHGVASDYFQVLHSEAGLDMSEVFEKLPGIPVAIHTHAKLRGSSYLSEYFYYKGKERNILIFDESLLSSLTSASPSSDIATDLYQFLRKYDQDGIDVPFEIYTYFKKISESIDKLETNLRDPFLDSSIIREDIEIPTDLVKEFNHPKLMRYASIISKSLKKKGREDEKTIFQDLLLLSKSEATCRQIFLQKEANGLVLFTMKEVLSGNIKNLVTLDASRETRTLFNFSKRKIQIYDIENFKSFKELVINAIKFPSGMGNIIKSFDPNSYSKSPNPYLIYLTEVVTKELERNMDPKFLIVHTKQLVGLKDSLGNYLARKKVMTIEESDKRFSYVTFGKENATNVFSHCNCVILLGLHWKPKFAIKSLLLGEIKEIDKIQSYMIDKTEIGELASQIQQATGRGTIRNGLPQTVYFCFHDTSIIKKGLAKAFKGATIQDLVMPELEDWKLTYGDEGKADRKRGNRVIKFKKYCNDKDIPYNQNLINEFLGQELPPKKFIEATNPTYRVSHKYNKKNIDTVSCNS